MAPAPPSRSGNRAPNKGSGQGPSINVLSLEGSLPQSRAGSRPGTNARLRTPSTAGGPRAANTAGASRGGTGVGQGLSSDREALMGVLVHKMREKFSYLAADFKTQEIIGQEVVSWVMSHPGATEEDSSSIEDKIRARLVISSYSNRDSCPDTPTSLGSPTRSMHTRPTDDDEWVTIQKFTVEEAKRKEKEERQKEAERRRLIKLQLDSQVKEHLDKRKEACQEDQEYAAKEKEDLEAWKKEEARKQEEKKRAAAALKAERDRQLQEQAEMKRDLEETKRREDEALKKQDIRDMKRARMAEERARKASKEAMKKFLAANEESRLMKLAAKKKKIEDEIEYTQQYTEEIEKQAEKRKAEWQARQDDQARRMAMALTKIPEMQKKGLVDEAMLERLQEQKQRENAEDEKRRQRALVDKREEMKRVLAQQLKDKEERRVRAKEEELALLKARLKQEADQAAADQARRKAEAERRIAHKNELERQIRERAFKKEPAMDDVEKAYNSGLLSKIKEVTIH
ncbi:hypothetical protein KFL_002950120 [Klebsormidium nitens]|uniref:Uncharacterized protein n=1 Tax=Klebsormidium nitens TaxID=105231 RepID=A0A1Y1I6G2_KLENI|nr:hypothetical protein KFL_002950120 [Klebsormidium nitens]|eukprot:GAQ86540.1 hypothetical protein KFL_002950120 [Klebsormidium nitens]